MRPIFIAAAIMLVITAAPLQAREPGGIALGSKDRPPAAENCVEVEIGGERTTSLACLNQELQRQVDRTNPARNVPPADAASPAVRVGGFSQTALRQQYGPNFGRSVIPYRPAQGHFTLPLQPPRR